MLKPSKEVLNGILNEFNAPIRFCAVYGSGAFPQKGYDGKTPMLDFIFGVTHAEHWHSLNLRQNPHHYSCLRYLGGDAIGITS